MRYSLKLILAAITLLYLILIIAEAATKAPYMDEFFVANPAYNLAFHGIPGTTGLEMTKSDWPGIDRNTFNTLPMGILALSLFYKIVGFGLIRTRLLSLIFGVALLGATAKIVSSLTRDSRRTWLTVTLLALNYTFVLAAGFGRVDMLTAASGMGAQAVYLALRLNHLRGAIFWSSTLIVISGLTHPNGVAYCACWIVLVLLDWSRLKWPYLAIAAAPFLVGGASWLAYVLRSPDDAAKQLRSNASQHEILDGLRHPVHAIVYEFEERYLHSVFGWNAGPRPPLAVRLKGAVTLVYFASVLGVLAIPALRRSRANQIILIQAAVINFYLCFFEALKFPWYLLIPVPLYCALLADLLLHFWDRRTVPRWSLALFALGLVAIHLGGVVYRILQNPYRTDYLPAVRFLKQHASPAQLVFAKHDFSFEYCFERNVVVDATWGYFSQKIPAYLVWDPNVAWDLDAWKRSDPRIYEHMEELIGSYKLVYQHGTYRIYERPKTRAAAPELTAHPTARIGHPDNEAG